MTPTNRLRFLEREVTVEGVSMDDCVVARAVRVLQQWWEPHYPGSAMDGEWRDVPLEVEE